jgi:DNA-binding transcriptional MerR regulator
MSGLLGPDGKPISSATMKKDPPPKLGEAFAPWAGRDIEHMTLPGGGLVQFDLSKLRLEDYRTMRDHYQVNSSLAVLSFMQHQSDWHIECEDKKIADSCTEMMQEIWTPLNRSLGTANWAGYSPNALDWDNDIQKRQVRITKWKDLIPEECRVHWDEVEGWAPPGRPRPKYKVYDGIDYEPQRGWPIPVENSFWYPLLMENGDYYGKKLLRPAFQSWFFSILIHLFANRYFERFGEPTPIGRAPFDEEVEYKTSTGTQRVRGNEYLLGVLQQLRNRSVVVLPNDRTQTGNNGQMSFDYEIEYLESQMRGADFERYLTRLDEEISLGLFTPILLLRTADVGSYNLGVGHMQVYLWMLNAMNDDRAQYINKYILRKFTNYNFSPNAPSPKIVFRKMGNTDTDLIKQLLVALVSGNKADVDLEELGTLAGLSLKQIRQTVTDPATETGEAARQPNKEDDEQLPEAKATLREIIARVEPQIENAFRSRRFDANLRINLGYKRKFQKALETEGVPSAERVTNDFYGRMDHWLRDVVSLGQDEFSGPESFMAMFNRVLESEFSDLQSRVGTR